MRQQWKVAPIESYRKHAAERFSASLPAGDQRKGPACSALASHASPSFPLLTSLPSLPSFSSCHVARDRCPPPPGAASKLSSPLDILSLVPSPFIAFSLARSL
eukprot:3097592-Pleurochrysis_carterae.AAC.1